MPILKFRHQDQGARFDEALITERADKSPMSARSCFTVFQRWLESWKIPSCTTRTICQPPTSTHSSIRSCLISYVSHGRTGTPTHLRYLFFCHSFLFGLRLMVFVLVNKKCACGGKSDLQALFHATLHTHKHTLSMKHPQTQALSRLHAHTLRHSRRKKLKT